jgi:mannose-6-phosphate isomerase-like protein (cupin superfamily)
MFIKRIAIKDSSIKECNMNSNSQPSIVRLSELQLPEFGYESDSAARVSGTFPFSAATGNKNTAVVYVVVEPGCYLPTHTDSAEEVLFFLAGQAAVTVGDLQAEVRAGEMAVVPAMAPHSVRNAGVEPLRFIGVFSSNTVMSTFDQSLKLLGQPPMSPLGERTVLTPLPIQLEQTLVAA